MITEKNSFDVIIVGAGPIGLACGIEATRRKLSFLILEKGCLVNSIYFYPLNMTFFSTSDKLEIGGVPFISHGNKPTRREALEYYRRVMESWKLKVNTYEKVLGVEGSLGKFEVLSQKARYNTKTVIVATGYYDQPNFLDIPGETLPKVKHYYDEPHPYAFKKIAVIGGANSAVDVALELFRVGAEVTMIIREQELWQGIKYWVKPDIENRIKENSINAYFNSNVKKILEDQIEIQTTDGKLTIPNDFVFAMTGYHADFDFFTKIGVEVKKQEYLCPTFNPNTFETNRPGLFLAGVVCGGMETSKLFIENSRDHAISILNYLEKLL